MKKWRTDLITVFIQKIWGQALNLIRLTKTPLSLFTRIIKMNTENERIAAIICSNDLSDDEEESIRFLRKCNTISCAAEFSKRLETKILTRNDFSYFYRFCRLLSGVADILEADDVGSLLGLLTSQLAEFMVSHIDREEKCALVIPFLGVATANLELLSMPKFSRVFLMKWLEFAKEPLISKGPMVALLEQFFERSWRTWALEEMQLYLEKSCNDDLEDVLNNLSHFMKRRVVDAFVNVIDETNETLRTKLREMECCCPP